MLIADCSVEGIGLGTAQFAFRDGSLADPVATIKGGHWHDGDRFPVDSRPQALRAHCEISLRTLPLVGASRPEPIRDSAILMDLTGEDLAVLRTARQSTTSA